MNGEVKYSGRIEQVFIYLNKLLRMFVFQSDWKVFPMAAVITEIVCFVVSSAMNKTMEGTVRGAFALTCVCIWNGMFNSIQVVCRERAIIKREHRSGMYISSYVAAHMIYQALLSLGQAVVMIVVMVVSKVHIPEQSYVTGFPLVDMAVTLFLITYAADIMALFVSSFVKNPTTAMTIVPFLLIFQLIFAGTFFNLKGFAEEASDFTISKWGISAMCSQGNYNDLPMTSIWTSMKKMENVEINGFKPVQEAIDSIEEENSIEDFQKACGKYVQSEQYESSDENITDCWSVIMLFTFLFAVLSVISLKFIDKDKR